jgi:hypothetical protein
VTREWKKLERFVKSLDMKETLMTSKEAMGSMTIIIEENEISVIKQKMEFLKQETMFIIIKIAAFL